MGQYYKPVVLDQEKKNIIGWVSSYTYDSGAKLMEHSWMKNDFVRAFENLIYNNPMPVVWAGDYADPENGLDEGPNLYQMRTDKTEINPTNILSQIKSRFIINHDTKEYVDKRKVPKDKDGWQMHPLPLLTCEGNGRGGGDYRGDSELIGLWSRNLISVHEKKPKGYTELVFDLVD